MSETALLSADGTRMGTRVALAAAPQQTGLIVGHVDENLLRIRWDSDGITTERGVLGLSYAASLPNTGDRG